MNERVGETHGDGGRDFEKKARMHGCQIAVIAQHQLPETVPKSADIKSGVRWRLPPSCARSSTSFDAYLFYNIR